METIYDLIKDQCPSGVKWVRLGDVFSRLKGTPITATLMKKISNPKGDVTIYAGGKTAVKAFTTDVPNTNIIDMPSVLVQSRGLIDVVYCDSPFTFKNEMWAYTHENTVTVKYLYYVLKTKISDLREVAGAMGAMPQISLKSTEELNIPLPPLPIQSEIVRILDAFFVRELEIERKLERELELRRKRREFYRDKLLSFEEFNSLNDHTQLASSENS